MVIPEYVFSIGLRRPSESAWNDNLGSVYRQRLLLVSLGKEKDVTLNVRSFVCCSL